MEEDLARLSALVAETSAQRLIILGDLIHNSRGVTPAVDQKIRRWRQGFTGDILVIRGNHDRGWKSIPQQWNLRWETIWESGPFLFSHLPKRIDQRFVWSGHLHPTYRVKSAHDELRLPCFYLKPRMGVLPAFSHFTRGVEVTKENSDRVFVTTDKRVFAVT